MIRRRTRGPRPRLFVGARVRVKSHVMDPNYPELPLGGWAGEIADVQPGTAANYLVRWSPDTLQHIHPIYRERCEQDDLSLDHTWLLEPDLERDRGGPLSIEHPVGRASQALTAARSGRRGSIRSAE